MDGVRGRAFRESDTIGLTILSISRSGRADRGGSTTTAGGGAHRKRKTVERGVGGFARTTVRAPLNF